MPPPLPELCLCGAAAKQAPAEPEPQQQPAPQPQPQACHAASALPASAEEAADGSQGHVDSVSGADGDDASIATAESLSRAFAFETAEVEKVVVAHEEAARSQGRFPYTVHSVNQDWPALEQAAVMSYDCGFAQVLCDELVLVAFVDGHDNWCYVNYIRDESESAERERVGWLPFECLGLPHLNISGEDVLVAAAAEDLANEMSAIRLQIRARQLRSAAHAAAEAASVAAALADAAEADAMQASASAAIGHRESEGSGRESRREGCRTQQRNTPYKPFL